MKKYLNKSMSVFLALLMVFSMFVFTPEMFTKAEAYAAGNYTLTLTFYVDDANNSGTSKLTIRYYGTNGTATTQSSQEFTVSEMGDSGNEGKTLTKDFSVPGFPTQISLLIDQGGMRTQKIQIKGVSVNGKTAISGTWTLDPGWWSSSTKTLNLLNGVGGNDNGDAKGQLIKPYPAKVVGALSDSIKVTANNTAQTFYTANQLHAEDQYGVAWFEDVNYVFADDPGDPETYTGTAPISIARASSTSSDADYEKAKISVTNGLMDYLLSKNVQSETVYAFAYFTDKNSSNGGAKCYSKDCATINLTQHSHKINYNLNGGSVVAGETQPLVSEATYYGEAIADYPTERTISRTGYTLGGMFNGDKQLKGDSEHTDLYTKVGYSASDETYKASWTPIDNPIEFYNSDGQLIEKKNGKYDAQIQSYGTPAVPSYPGKTTSIDGTYAFDKWIVWSAPEHPEWEAQTYDSVKAKTLDCPTENKPIKFIATYKLSDGSTVKRYNVSFKNPAGAYIDIGEEESVAYWTPIYPTEALKSKSLYQESSSGSAVTKANGFDLDNYDYHFEGWTTTEPENGKWGTEAEMEYGVKTADGTNYIFVDLDGMEHTYRVKSDVVFYPCYSKTVKQCSITRKYYQFNNLGRPVVNTDAAIKDETTTLGTTYNLGVPDPISFNYGGYTYSFVGWKNTTTNVRYGEGEPDVEYVNGKAEYKINGDATFIAIYEKTEIQYNAYYYNGSEVIRTYPNLSRYSEGEALITYNTATQFVPVDDKMPERARTGNIGYEFVGWVEDQTKTVNPSMFDLVEEYQFGEQSKSFYAAYKTFNYYIVTFRNEDGVVIQKSVDYLADDVIAYTDKAPEEENVYYIPVIKNKESGVQYQYTFMGWISADEADNVLSFYDETQGKDVEYALGVGEDITVNADKTYTAVFKKELRKYNIGLYDIGTDLSKAKVNADGYSCYTDADENLYFVKENAIYTKAEGEYTPYEGGKALSDLTMVKPDAIKVLSLDYGENILNAVKDLYKKADGSAATGDAEVSQIADTELKIIPYGEEKEQTIPYETDQYIYLFNGWTPAINPNAVVTGDKDFVAAYKTDNVIYNVHWYTPTAFGTSEPYAPADTYTEQTVYYRYKRTIGIPAKTPEATSPAEKDNYTWSFLGWYECDEDKVIKTDSEGNEIKFTRGTIADPGDNHNRDFYYVAKFGYVANNYTVSLYDEAGAKLLGTYKGEYGTSVYLNNYSKAPDEDYHYTLSAFADKTSGETVVAANLETNTTEYTVTGDISLKIVYAQVPHDWENAAVTHTLLPTYKDTGVDTYTCECGYKKTEEVPVLVDTNGPVGKIAIRTYNWDKDGGASEAFIRSDSLIAIMASDRGQSANVQGEGYGIKEISYTWSNGAAGDSETYEKFEKPAANFDIQIPQGEDFTEGMTLTAVITDWIDETYTITTGALYTDATKPVITAETTCEGFKFAVTEDNIDTVTATVNGEDFDLSAYKLSDADLEAYLAEMNEGKSEEEKVVYNEAYVAEKTETSVVRDGKYVITVKDKAGNTATITFNVTNAHKWNAGKVTKEVTCLEDGEKTFTCTVCGGTKTEVIESTGHKWNGKYDGEELVEYTYTVDEAATCTEEGEQSIYCSVCGEMMEDSTIILEPLGHDEVVKEKAATCDEDGYKVVTCKRCDLYERKDATNDDSYKAFGHTVKLDAEGADENGWIVGTAATCTAKGSKYQICSVCEKHINVTAISLAAHNFEDKTPEGDYCEAAAVEGGTKDTYHLYICKDCTYSYEFNPEAKAHDYVKQEPAKAEATCEDNAVYVYSCTKCDSEYEKEERLSKLEHVWDTEYTVDIPATCTEDGSKSIHCTRDLCEATKNVTVIPKLGHNYQLDEENSYPATCHSDGKNVYVCVNAGCGFKGYRKADDVDTTEDLKETKDEEYTVAVYIPDSYEEVLPAEADSHNWDDGVVTKEASCTEEGKTTYTCKDEGCNEVKTEVIPKKAHEASEEVKEHTDATCKAYEKTVYKCKNCDEGTVTVYGSEYAEHTQGTLAKTLTRATCTEEGEGVYNCSVCGQTFKDVIPATGEHNYVAKVTTAATCTVKGVKTFTCTVCKDSYTEDIEELGHDYQEYTEEATCTSNGSTCMKCTRCGDVKEGSGENIPALTHDIQTVPAVAASCTSTGLTEGKACTRCDYVEVAQTVTDKVPHTKGDLLTVNKAATCAKEGEGVYLCTVCTGTFTDKIAVDESAHNWGSWSDWEEVTAPNCMEKGSEKATRACSNKDCVKTEEKTREIDALGHNLVIDHVGDPVTVGGVTTVTTYYKCDREGCDYTTSEDEVTTLFTATVGEKTINLLNGEKLTEAKIAEALGALPSKDAEEGEDGIYKVIWKIDGVETKLPAEVSKNVSVTYEFKFVANTYTVTFLNASGKIISQKADYIKGDTVIVPDDQYVSGYKFLGWTDGENSYPANEIPDVTADVTYTPWLESNENFTTLYVTFKNDTGTKTLYTASVDCHKGDTVSFGLPEDLATPTKERNSVYHYNFDKWVDIDGNDVTFPVDITKSVTFKATFTYERHTADKKVVKVSSASCTAPEITTYQCNVCGYKWDEYTADANGHSYRETNRTVDGNTTIIDYYCDECGDTYTRTVTSGSQQEVIVVKVSDGTNPLAGAKVVIYKGDVSYTAMTDENGCAYFDKEVVGDGIYQANISKDGYSGTSGKLNVKNGTAILKTSVAKEQCHCGCHRSGFFGDIKRFFNKILRLFNKNYVCCKCGECEKIY